MAGAILVVSIALFLCLKFIFGYYLSLTKLQSVQNEDVFIKDQDPQVTPNLNSDVQDNTTQVQAWIYPGSTTCSVKRELESSTIVVDVLKPEYFSLNESGEVTLLTEAELGCNGFSQENVSLVKKFSKEQYITVSGRIDSMRPFLRNENRSKSEQRLVSFAVEHDVSGIEIDFEDFSSWSREDYSLYLQFIESLGKQLQAKGKNLLVAGPPVSNSIEESYYNWRYADFVKLPVHQIIVMAYDYQADHGNGTPVAPNNWVIGIISYMKQVFPDSSRVVIGIPSYGYSGTEGSFQSKLVTLQEARKLPGFSQAIRDSESFEMKSVVGNAVLYYQDTTSLQKKRQLVESQGITAISVWHLGGNAWF